jgi:hypothetical protein
MAIPADRLCIVAPMAAPALRPLGIGETLDVAIKIYMRNAVPLIKLVLLVVAPVTLLAVLVEASAYTNVDEFSIDPDTGQLVFSESDLWTEFAGLGVALLLTLVASVLATAACFKAVADAYLGEAVDWLGSLRFALRRLHSILWVTTLGVVLSVLALVLCILPGIWLWYAFAVAVPALLTEGLKGRKALGRSRRLVQGRWWKVFAAIFLGTLLTTIVSGALQGLATVVASDDLASFEGVVTNWVSQTVASTLTTPFTAAIVIVVYFDLRVRKEAFDLELLARQLGVDPPEGAVPAHLELFPAPAPGDGAQDSGDTPPFWPPPPGWQPSSKPSSEPEVAPPDQPDEQV